MLYLWPLGKLFWRLLILDALLDFSSLLGSRSGLTAPRLAWERGRVQVATGKHQDAIPSLQDVGGGLNLGLIK